MKERLPRAEPGPFPVAGVIVGALLGALLHLVFVPGAVLFAGDLGLVLGGSTRAALHGWHRWAGDWPGPLRGAVRGAVVGGVVTVPFAFLHLLLHSPAPGGVEGPGPGFVALVVPLWCLVTGPVGFALGFSMGRRR